MFHSPTDKSMFFPQILWTMCSLFNRLLVHKMLKRPIHMKKMYLIRTRSVQLWCHQFLCIKTLFNLKKSIWKYSFTDTWCTEYAMTMEGLWAPSRPLSDNKIPIIQYQSPFILPRCEFIVSATLIYAKFRYNKLISQCLMELCYNSSFKMPKF